MSHTVFQNVSLNVCAQVCLPLSLCHTLLSTNFDRSKLRGWPTELSQDGNCFMYHPRIELPTTYEGAAGGPGLILPTVRLQPAPGLQGSRELGHAQLLAMPRITLSELYRSRERGQSCLLVPALRLSTLILCAGFSTSTHKTSQKQLKWLNLHTAPQHHHVLQLDFFCWYCTDFAMCLTPGQGQQF